MSYSCHSLGYMMPKWMRLLLWSEPVIVPQMEFERTKELASEKLKEQSSNVLNQCEKKPKELSSNVLNQCEKKAKVEDSLKPHLATTEPENMICVNQVLLQKKTMSLLPFLA